jgi:hypothetical protein
MKLSFISQRALPVLIRVKLDRLISMLEGIPRTLWESYYAECVRPNRTLFD